MFEKIGKLSTILFILLLIFYSGDWFINKSGIFNTYNVAESAKILTVEPLGPPSCRYVITFVDDKNFENKLTVNTNSLILHPGDTVRIYTWYLYDYRVEGVKPKEK